VPIQYSVGDRIRIVAIAHDRFTSLRRASKSPRCRSGERRKSLPPSSRSISSAGMEVRPVDARDAGEIERGVAALARTSNSGLSRHGGVREELATGVGRVLINAQIAACTEFADCEEFRFQFTKL
jgi:hypothetical protein